MATRLLRIAMAVTVLLLVVAAPAVATHGNPDKAVPIHGTNGGADQMLDLGRCPEAASWRYANTGSGVFSHLGRVAFELEHCTYMDWDTGTGYLDEGITTITAANGDVLVLAHEGVFELTFTEEWEPEYSIVTMTWEVTGGTGRFAGATGSGATEAVSDLLAGYTSATYHGTILYDASNRSAR